MHFEIFTFQNALTVEFVKTKLHKASYSFEKARSPNFLFLSSQKELGLFRLRANGTNDLTIVTVVAFPILCAQIEVEDVRAFMIERQERT